MNNQTNESQNCINRYTNKFYLFLPINLDSNIAFDNFEKRIKECKLFDKEENRTRYLFKYIYDKFNNDEYEKNQCFTYKLNENSKNKFGLNEETIWQHSRFVGKADDESKYENYYFNITGISLYHFRTGLFILAYELKAINTIKENEMQIATDGQMPAQYISTLQFCLKDINKAKIYRPNIEDYKASRTIIELTKSIMACVLKEGENNSFFPHIDESNARANMLSYVTVDSKDKNDIKKSLYYLKRMYSKDYAYLEDSQTDEDEYFSCVKYINWGITSECAVCLVEMNDENESFIANSFSKNFSDEYKFMYVLLLHQKYVLYRFLTKIGVGIHNDLKTLEKYHEDLCEFQTNFMFTRITEVPQYQKLYEKISSHFHLKELYDDVDNPVNGLSELKISKENKTLNNSLMALSLLTIFSALTDGFDFFEKYVNDEYVIYMQILCLIIILLTAAFFVRSLIHINSKRKHKKPKLPKLKNDK